MTSSWNHRMLDDLYLHVRRPVLRAEDLLRRGAEIGLLRLEDVRHERMRIPIDEREPAALYLHANLVSLEESVILRVQVDHVLVGVVGNDRLRALEALAEPAAKH